ncbi:MAG: hypothetical protein ACRCYV_09450 [Aeromonas sp.]
MPSEVLDLRRSYVENVQWQSKAHELVALFVANFARFIDTAKGQALVAAGPQP